MKNRATHQKVNFQAIKIKDKNPKDKNPKDKTSKRKIGVNQDEKDHHRLENQLKKKLNNKKTNRYGDNPNKFTEKFKEINKLHINFNKNLSSKEGMIKTRKEIIKIRPDGID